MHRTIADISAIQTINKLMLVSAMMSEYVIMCVRVLRSQLLFIIFSARGALGASNLTGNGVALACVL